MLALSLSRIAPSLLPAAPEHGEPQSSGSDAGSLRRHHRFPTALRSPGKEERRRLRRLARAPQERDQLQGTRQG